MSNPCGDIVGALDPAFNRAESCNAVSGDAVACYGVNWITVPLSAAVLDVDWIVIPKPGTT